MSDMDLIPAEFRRGLTLRRQINWFVGALLILLVVVTASRAALGYLVWREKEQVVDLQERQQALAQSQSETESLRQQHLLTQQQLATLDQLKGGDRLAQFLNAIDDAYIEQVWLDTMHFQRRENSAAAADAPGNEVAVGSQTAAVEAGFEGLHEAEIAGHASSHSELATFMQRLGAQPAVADLRLISTATRSYTSVQVIDFKLALQLRGREMP